MEILILAAATYRLAYMFVWEDGPYEVLHGMRTWLKVEEPEENTSRTIRTVAYLFGCVYCMSFWTGLLFTLLYLVSVKWSVIIALPFALSSLTFLMERIRD